MPAMPVAQPGHCAMIWRGPSGRRAAEPGSDHVEGEREAAYKLAQSPNQRWELENDGGCLAQVGQLFSCRKHCR